MVEALQTAEHPLSPGETLIQAKSLAKEIQTKLSNNPSFRDALALKFLTDPFNKPHFSDPYVDYVSNGEGYRVGVGITDEEHQRRVGYEIIQRGQPATVLLVSYSTKEYLEQDKTRREESGRIAFYHKDGRCYSNSYEAAEQAQSFINNL